MGVGSGVSSGFEVRFDIDTENGHRLTVLRPGGPVKRYDVKLDLCENPVCACWDLNLVCTPADEAEPSGAPSRALCLDLGSQQVTENRSRMAPADLALARGLAATLSPGQWRELRRLFITAKRRMMESCDLAALDVVFPLETELEGTMVGYTDIFHWAEYLRFEANGERWLVDDLYCVQPGCNCHDAVVLFYPVGAAEEHLETEESPTAPPTVQPAAAVRFDLRRGTAKVEPDPPAEPSVALGLMKALEQSHPDVKNLFTERRRILRSLYSRYLRRTESRHRPTTPPRPKVGRNDPCPCGSGKKYKRCCGR